MATLAESYPRAAGYSDSTSAERDDASSSIAFTRPNIIRRDTDQILSYYQSQYAGQSYEDHEQQTGLSRRASGASHSSSEYSAESTHVSQTRQKADIPISAAGHVRRPSVPSQESVDRRRLAIVELDQLPPSVRRKESSHNGSTGASARSALLSRRGVHVNGLALVAPPDASPATYTDLTPPPTAPVVVGDRGPSITPQSWTAHTRSTSEATGSRSHLRHKSSRDIGIVGIGVVPTISESAHHSSFDHTPYTDSGALQVPIFQTPSDARTPSPAARSPVLAERGTPSISDPAYYSWDHPSDSGNRQQTTTPAIGEGKDIQQPVVGPVVVGLHSGKVLRREPMQPMDINNVSGTRAEPSYTPHYESAVHSARGSLPPPRTMFDVAAASAPVLTAPPPRPPRMRTPMPLSQTSTVSAAPAKHDLQALKESLQLPQSVSSVLASRPDLKRSGTDISHASSSSIDTKESAVSDSAIDTKRSRSIHRREGAFPPSTQTTAKSTPESSPIVGTDIGVQHTTSMASTSSIPPRVPSPESEYEDTDDNDRRSAIELKRDPSWVSLKDSGISSSPNGRSHTLPHSRSRSHSRSPAPAPPPKASPGLPMDDVRSPSSTHSTSSNPFKTTLQNLKRFSALPRTPSSLSMKSSLRTDSTPRSPRTPSPALFTSPNTPRQKVINPWPDAMTFRDITVMKNPLERATAYAQKIQELSGCDTGLSEWLKAMQQKGASNRSARNSTLQLDIGLSHPSTRQSNVQHQPRHVSQSSVASEATFPIRRDAYMATDLMMRPDEDVSLTRVPPTLTLPYPSLAVNLPSRSSTTVPPTPRSYQVPLSSGAPRSATGFFSSIGRKASLKKSETSPSAPNRVLTKRGPPRSPPTPAPAPTIPGGPRAPPNKIQRAHTMSVAAPSAASMEQPPVSVTRSDTRSSVSTTRRPSFFHRSAAAFPIPPPDAEFERQVDKLADLLPHADRGVLSGYLRRAGQDILAIGQYLEDEKKGTIRYD